MATLRQLSSGKWQVQIRRSGLPPVAKSFKGRNDAQAWARQIESEMDRGTYFGRAEAESTTIADLIDRYLIEVTP